MATYLAYWKSYWSQVTNPRQVKPYWATNSHPFYSAVDRGDTIWGVIPGPSDESPQWRLIQKVVVQSKRVKPTEYGQYYIAGDRKRSVVFAPKLQPDFTPVLWLLEFASGSRIRLQGAKIGQALQSHGARRLSHWDTALLEEYAEALSAMGVALIRA